MNRIDLPDNIKTCNIEDLEIVSAECRSHFNDNTLHVSSYRDPSNTETDPNVEEAEKLAELKISNAMMLTFNNKTNYSNFFCLFMIHIHYSARRLS